MSELCLVRHRRQSLLQRGRPHCAALAKTSRSRSTAASAAPRDWSKYDDTPKPGRALSRCRLQPPQRECRKGDKAARQVLRSTRSKRDHGAMDDRLYLRCTFDSATELYGRAGPQYPAELFDVLITIAGLQRGDRVLEIGCATGQATRPLAERGLSIVLRRARRGSGDGRKARAGQLPQRPGHPC